MRSKGELLLGPQGTTNLRSMQGHRARFFEAPLADQHSGRLSPHENLTKGGQRPEISHGTLRTKVRSVERSGATLDRGEGESRRVSYLSSKHRLRELGLCVLFFEKHVLRLQY